MNRMTYGLLAFIGFGLILQAFVPPATAQECISVDVFIDESKAMFPDFLPAAAATYNGRVSDTTLLYVAGNVLWMAGFSAGCLVYGPFPVDDVLAPAEPAPAVPAAPATPA